MLDFNNVLERYKDFNFLSFLNSRSENDIISVLSKNELTEIDFLTLLSPASSKSLEQMAIKAKEITRREFGNTIQIYTPLYLSNYCTNGCTYCGFNKDNKGKRAKLSFLEVHSWCKKIKNEGFYHVLLLTGGDRIQTPVSYIGECVKIARDYFDSVSIEVYGMDYNEYLSLTELGVENLTIYQETYNRDTYSNCHPYGEKRNFNYRLNAPERGAQAGFRSIGFGSLLGLSEPNKDFFLTALHSSYIMRKYPHVEISMSLPRIKNAGDNFKGHFIVNDLDFVKFILSYRLFIPKAGISISTREDIQLRNNLLGLGVTRMSASSKTSVGSGENESSNQFNKSDPRSAIELEIDLREKGFEPVFKDWVLI